MYYLFDSMVGAREFIKEWRDNHGEDRVPGIRTFDNPVHVFIPHKNANDSSFEQALEHTGYVHLNRCSGYFVRRIRSQLYWVSKRTLQRHEVGKKEWELYKDSTKWKSYSMRHTIT